MKGTQNQFSCFVVGEGTLPIQCTELLLNHGHHIFGIISSDAAVRDWAKGKGIPDIQPTDNLVEVLRQQPFDYLFSIVNTSILSKEILELPRQYAISFHDAPLPKYAGVNPTSWALINREKTHGVTWYVMGDVEGGDILKQVTIDIADRETAFTLNGKCYEAAIDSFAALIDELSAGKVVAVKQNQNDRTYFPPSQRPNAGGLLDFTLCAYELDALVRALDFGSYPNPLGQAKLAIEDDFIVVSKLEVLDELSELPPGTITAIEPDFLQVSTISYEIALRQLQTINGQALLIPDLVERFGLEVGYRFKDIEPELANRLEKCDRLIAKHEAFWVERLASLEPITIPYAQTKVSLLKQQQYANVKMPVPDEVITFLEERHPSWNPGDFLLAAFVGYLARIGGTDCFDVGYRDAELVRESIGTGGFFASAVPSRLEIDFEQSFETVFAAVRDQVALTKLHLTYARDVVVRYPQLGSLRELGGEKIFPVVIERVESWQDGQAIPGNELTLIIPEDGKECSLLYNTEVLDGDSVARMVEQFTIFLQGIISDSSQRLAYLPLLSEEELHKILVDWNDTAADYPKDKCIHQLFEEQMERTPDNLAVVFEDKQLTYRELNARANQLAHYLQKLGVGPDVLVGICVERSIEMIVGLLSILKAGGAYVPLDPNYPQERLSFMLGDTQVPVLLTQQHLVDKLPKSDALLFCLDSEWDTLTQKMQEHPIGKATPDNLVYAIYTSGSTGKPKGVMNTHRGLCNRLLWMQDAYQLTEADCVLQKTPFSFDVSVWEFFWPLFTGSRLVIARPEGHKDSAYLVNLIAEQKITTLHFVPSMLQIFLEEEGLKGCNTLKRVICSGEALPFELQERFFTRLEAELHNLYGPTEASIDVTFWVCSPESNQRIVPIGRPIANTQMYILDSHLQPVPVGLLGELHIGGIGLARGYLNQPNLTAEKFISNPFNKESGVRLYKTGDLARYLPEGNIEFLGRLDNQVKIRGFRIELGEIESALALHPAVQEKLLIAWEEPLGDKRLVAYVVPDAEYAFAIRQLLRLEKDNFLVGLKRYELPNGMVIIHLNKSETDFIYKEIFEERQYLKHGIILNEGDCIFDVGANIGLFSLFIGQICNNAKIFAFEPIPPIFDLLCLNTTIYGLNAKLFCCGISSESKRGDFTYYPQNSVVSGRFANAIEERDNLISFWSNKQQEGDVSEIAFLSSEEIDELTTDIFTSQNFTCQMKTISEVIREQSIERIDLLKIDVEKSELDVLAGIQEEDWLKIGQIVVEVHDINGQLDSVTELLLRHGYEFAIEQEKVLKNTGIYNIYAVRPLSTKDSLVKTTSQQSGALKQTWSSPNRLVSAFWSFLQDKLPDYMIPSSFVLLDTLPLTPNGKIDRRALPPPDSSRPNLAETFVAPRTPIEQELADIWTSILKLENIGVGDNFFNLGGHSILATQIISRVRQTFSIELPLRVLFEAPTIAEFSSRIETVRWAAQELSVSESGTTGDYVEGEL